MTRLVYLSPVPWASFAQRPHKFAEWFHLRTGGNVLWIDPYPTRLPKPIDFKRRNAPMSGKSTNLDAWIEVIKPRAVPIEPIPILSSVNRFMWAAIFSEVKRFVEGNDALIAAGKPSLLANLLVSEYPNIPSLYDAMDEFPAFYSGLSKAVMRRREKNLAGKCTHMWVSSTRLQTHWSKLRSDLNFVPNGLEPTLYSTINKVRNAESRKIFGYIGTIAQWFDWEWVIKLANARPNDLVRVIGPVFAPPPRLLPNNIELLPPCAHEEAISAMAKFDVGIIPFQNNNLTASVDPIKFYEYRAMSLPVISTDFGEMSLREESQGTFISRSLTDIEHLAHDALLHQDAPEFVQSFIKENGWPQRFDSANLLKNAHL
ncbi:glycosyltransferase family 1 protein [Rhizobium sp. P38BS-XIX]|uniref:glycosyltransferase family 1 protein n=1 Tax=Rhizobium sp. P38BS-XIX TaxID=2726740 RepID=UPI001456C511|nr:glycosyltransferase family 1 protein [Rhizobium sp. P38BS-XIX]NLR99426.1 glycosyltransferase family 1 protein [Rhizobium sp. P38BS-XIX]